MEDKNLFFIFHNKDLKGIFYSNTSQWELLGSKRSLCELVSGKYYPETELNILMVKAEIVKTIDLEK
jgi:hypothetical protein